MSEYLAYVLFFLILAWWSYAEWKGIDPFGKASDVTPEQLLETDPGMDRDLQSPPVSTAVRVSGK